MTFRERGRWRRERNIKQLPLVRVPTGDQIRNLGLCPDGELNLQPLGAQGNPLINRATWLGLHCIFFH